MTSPEVNLPAGEPADSDGPAGPKLLRPQRRPPSPPWYGALITVGGLGLMAAILLTYTLAGWDWQQRLGGWNYVVVIALIPVTSVLMKRWQPDETL